MNDEPLNDKPDLTLGFLGKQDLYTLSVSDLKERIEALKFEIGRCETALDKRGGAKSEADKLFKI